jgi:single-strand selective monofunctional uracil DNA glycosylase
MLRGMAESTTPAAMIRATRRLAAQVDALGFSAPAAHVYNPIAYARAPHESWLRGYATGRPRVVFVGMNPGPWGMAQTGVPFGDVQSVRGWLGIEGRVRQPALVHPKHPVLGFDCPRREVSGARFWGLMRDHYGAPAAFAADAFVANYCPLMFIDEAGRNLTPDKLRTAERKALEELCDSFLLQVIRILSPAWVVGIGGFARKRIDAVLERAPEPRPAAAVIPHPSPASPRANRGWAGLARGALEAQGIWRP